MASPHSDNKRGKNRNRKARVLASHKLGQMGESRFSGICAEAGLTCNISTQDETGWDFIVEFPMDPPQGGATLDKRAVPISCHVQVKTIWASNDTINMRLSSAERLAKETKPSFVYVLKVDDELNYVSAYLIHLLDDNLATILKRLRKEQAAGRHDVNHMKIGFRPRKAGTQLDVTGAAFVDALKRICGADLQAYIQTKQSQLTNLGFGRFRYEGTFNLTTSGPEELADVLLGLKKAPLEDFRSVEMRFGIPLPTIIPYIERGEIRLSPNATDQCDLSIRRDKLSAPITFRADLIVPHLPGMEIAKKYLLKTKMFSFAISGQSRFKFVPDPALLRPETRFELDDWIKYLKMIDMISSGPTVIEVVPDKLARGEFFVPSAVAVKKAEWFQRLLKFFERAREILKLAGVGEAQVSYADAVANGYHISVACAFMLGVVDEVAEFSFTSDKPEGMVVPEKIETVLVHKISIGDVSLGYSVLITLKPKEEEHSIFWQSSSCSPIEVTLLRTLPKDYEDFVCKSKNKSATGSFIRADDPTVTVIPVVSSGRT